MKITNHTGYVTTSCEAIQYSTSDDIGNELETPHLSVAELLDEPPSS